ncbi:MAG: hypothetical protein C4582_09420 [Desulfobacteraceae bacterium]|nr:MAG: hypothetical protein C4582_09420 [Desulfobacteraceae bacterium]
MCQHCLSGPRFPLEQKGQLSRANVAFENDEHVLRILDRIVAPLGRRVDESSPTVDARLPDGSRVNAVIRPIALCGPTITIRKFSKKPLTIDEVFAKIDGVTAEDILRVAGGIIKPERLHMALVGPYGNREKFLQLLRW